ncbi:hypothetical protein P167DRAFT_570310 [Morchella conica CCBAS932]|uniref:Uncharacterized protein n=1 Tax=Morchella conica CCBAS932 TaxID=1392247 RepID=A0A3N4L4Y4_9PEZI|nr:hypothetical protein P167DRAFT_570310 [Morchella conica CCBAS932]
MQNIGKFTWSSPPRPHNYFSYWQSKIKEDLMKDGLWAIMVGSSTFEDFCNDYTSYIEGTSDRFPALCATFDFPYDSVSYSDSDSDHDLDSNSGLDSDSDADSDADSDSTDTNLSTSPSEAESFTVSELLVEFISNSRSELLEKMKQDWKILNRNACERILFTMDKKTNIRYQRFRDPRKLWERLVKDNPECGIDRNRQYRLTRILYNLKLGAPGTAKAGIDGRKEFYPDFDWSVRWLFEYESILIKKKIEAEIEHQKQEKLAKLAKQSEKHRAILERHKPGSLHR